MRNFIQEITILRYLFLSDMFLIKTDNFKQLREIEIVDIHGYGNHGLNGNSFKFNTKLEKAKLHFGSVWNSNNAILNTIFTPTTNIKEICITDSDVGDDFFASLQDKTLHKITLNTFYTKNSRNELAEFLNSQRNNLKSLEFLTYDRYSPDFLELSQINESRTIFSQLREITISTFIQDNLTPHYPRYNIRKINKMYKSVNIINFHFNQYKEVKTLLRTLCSFQNVSLVKFIDKNSYEKEMPKKHIKKIDMGISKKSIRIFKRKPHLTILIQSDFKTKRINYDGRIQLINYN